jgi:Flp pilus assembly protein TadG
MMFKYQSNSIRKTAHRNGAGLRTNAANRKGAALVELAVCLPVLMILILGSIEATGAIFVRQALTTAAYEAAREASRTGATTATATERGQAVLDARRIQNSTISFTPADVAAATRGSLITIEVTATLNGNSPFTGRVIPNQVNRVRTVMVKE